ncbi:hypothetical protein QFC24_001110 [Naganishia onofrii]|uniref:Uncharacterized protein n=1 Tax=Naganishia onofrii TaxID=1851511 RepID=A0ACC2XVP1_9TREE|nr:hypothetical protein QFC24_001110 [Naganishia onofrii]
MASSFVNTAGLDFASVNDRKPVEEIKLVAQREGVEYAVRYVGLSASSSHMMSSSRSRVTLVLLHRPSKFSAVRSLQIYFPANVSGGDDEETSRVYYVGLKGEWTAVSLKRLWLIKDHDCILTLAFLLI